MNNLEGTEWRFPGVHIGTGRLSRILQPSSPMSFLSFLFVCSLPL